MKLIVGLGNPGDKYERTRHNAGFWLLERFAAQSRTSMRKDAKFQALVGRHAETGAWLVMPQGFMNASGHAVQLIASFYKIDPGEILVAHDELDFAPGVVKMKRGGGIAGHNGLRDISSRLGTHDYWRLRLGVGHPGDRNAVIDYVLNKPSMDDRTLIDAAIDRALQVMPLLLGGDTQAAMLKLHTPDKAADAKKADKPEKPARAAENNTVAAPAPAPAPQPEVKEAEQQSGWKSLLGKFKPGEK